MDFDSEQRAGFPDRKLVFIGDGAYSAKNLLGDLDPRVTYVGVMRSDAAIYDPRPPKQSKSKRGRKPGKGSRLPNPKQAVEKADRNRNGRGPWVWQTIQAPQHGCQQSIEKLSPWVWLMQSVISLWYITDGRKLPQARAARRRFGKWDTEWSLGHMLRKHRAEILADTMKPESATKADLYQLLDHPEKYLNLAS